MIKPVVYLNWLTEHNIFMASSSLTDLTFLTDITDNWHNWALLINLVLVRRWNECQWELRLHVIALNCCLLSTHIQEKTLQVRHEQPFPHTCIQWRSEGICRPGRTSNMPPKNLPNEGVYKQKKSCKKSRRPKPSHYLSHPLFTTCTNS